MKSFGHSAGSQPENHSGSDGISRQGVSPQTTFEFEKELEQLLREIGRRTLETVFNRLEAEDPESLPKHFTQQQQEYSRKQEKSNNRGGIGTCFGTIPLRRFSCEPLQEAREDGQKSFAIGMAVGDRGGRRNACPGGTRGAYGRGANAAGGSPATDRGSRRAVVSGRVAQGDGGSRAGVAEHLHQAQKVQLLEWLRQADGSKGRHVIVLAVGRDGIMLPIRGEKTYKEGAVATIAVYDRRGRRLGTVYLGHMPQAYQTTLSDQLTRLLTEVLREWSGSWPRLVYVTDAGYHPTEYFENVLESMEDPRIPAGD